VVDFKIL